MTTSEKKLLILGLCSGLGDMLMTQTMDDEVFRHARRFKTLADRAIGACHIRITHQMLKRIKDKLSEVYTNGTEFNVVEVLSLCILGLMDLQHYSGEGTPVDAVLTHAMYFTKLWDPKLQDEDSHSAAVRKYRDWLE